MSPVMTFRIAFKALGRNKMRTGLTMLGMIIGVAAVITLVAMGNGAQSVIEDQIKGAGTNMITVNAGNFTSGGVRGGSGASSTLTARTRRRFATRCRACNIVAAGSSDTERRSSPATRTGSPAFRAPTSICRSSAPGRRKAGSFFSAQDVTSAAKVAVLGTTVNDTLFGAGRGSDRSDHPHPQPAVQGHRRDGDEGPGAWARTWTIRSSSPYTTVMKKLMGVDLHPERHRLGGVGGRDERRRGRDRRAAAHAPQDRARARTTTSSSGPLEEIADIRTQAMGTMTTLLAGIAGVSLIVGGIGIMNIMLVSVTERTREIGLRMAIGAKGRDVLLQFLVEAIALSLIGGGIGIALGFGLAEGMQRWMSWPAKVPANAVAMAFGFAAAVGVFFGFYPAQKAARLDPIEALRFE